MGNIDGFKQALEALQALDEADRIRILTDIAKKNPQMAERLKENLFDFSDLQFMLAGDFKIIWWEIPRNTWILALRKAPAGVMKMIQSHLSQRAFKDFQDSVSDLGPQPLSKVIHAQKEICDGIRELAGQGKMAAPSRQRNDPMI